MTIEFHCGNCHTLLRTGDDKAGMRAKCPHCQAALVTPDPTSQPYGEVPPDSPSDYGDPPAAADPFDQLFGGGDGQSPFVKPRSQAPGNPPRTSPCPMCGAEVPPNAPTCPGCGEPTPAGRRKGGHVPTSGKAIAALILGLVGLFSFQCVWILGFFAVPCDIAAIVMGVLALGQIRTGEFEGKAQAWVGIGTGSLGLVISAGVLIFALLQIGG